MNMREKNKILTRRTSSLLSGIEYLEENIEYLSQKLQTLQKQQAHYINKLEDTIIGLNGGPIYLSNNLGNRVDVTHELATHESTPGGDYVRYTVDGYSGAALVNYLLEKRRKEILKQ